MPERPTATPGITPMDYEQEGRVKGRIYNGLGGTFTRLPKGHLARRDTVNPPIKNTGRNK
jgi:hypothetical protein